MRIISGNLKGRQFKSPPGRRTHPMSEKMRGALFNALGDITNLTVLDAYAGSGAVAFEAISRGAQYVTAVEKSVLAYKTVVNSSKELNVEDEIKVTRANISTWSDNNVDLTFDIVHCDPPYDDIRPNVLNKLIRNVNYGGLFVISWPGGEELEEFAGLKIVKNNNFGDSQLVFYKKTR